MRHHRDHQSRAEKALISESDLAVFYCGWWSIRCGNLGILLGEFLMELLHFVQQDLQLICRWQDGHSGQAGEEQKDIYMDFEESLNNHFKK